MGTKKYLYWYFNDEKCGHIGLSHISEGYTASYQGHSRLIAFFGKTGWTAAETMCYPFLCSMEIRNKISGTNRKLNACLPKCHLHLVLPERGVTVFNLLVFSMVLHTQTQVLRMLQLVLLHLERGTYCKLFSSILLSIYNQKTIGQWIKVQ